jgi:hypothetical protein
MNKKSIVHEQILCNKRDEEANSFTIHEAKNGVLGAMVLCDTIMEQLPQSNNTNVERSVLELHGHLQMTLNIILAVSISRELIHGTYSAVPERIDLNEIFYSTMNTIKGNNFTFSIKPRNARPLFVDPKLLHHIHRNAISNACKYGKRTGTVHTEVEYTEGILYLRVFNLPGADHEALIALPDPNIVFEKGIRIASTDISTSAGDGGWIMKKCCEALGGSCKITFNTEGTLFEMSCRVPEIIDRHNFILPDGSIAIGIDDSALQRKILCKIFELVGVPLERMVILGSTDDEILNMRETITTLLNENPKSNVFVIIDESLELSDGRTLSGSLELSKLKETVSPELYKNTLIVVRSANDSKSDCDKYKERVHSVMPKVGFNKQGLREQITSMWLSHF